MQVQIHLSSSCQVDSAPAPFYHVRLPFQLRFFLVFGHALFFCPLIVENPAFSWHAYLRCRRYVMNAEQCHVRIFLIVNEGVVY